MKVMWEMGSQAQPNSEYTVDSNSCFQTIWSLFPKPARKFTPTQHTFFIKQSQLARFSSRTELYQWQFTK